MKITAGFIKIHQAVYKTSALTFLPRKALIFITKTKKSAQNYYFWGYIDKQNMHCYSFGDKNFIFLLEIVKKTKKIPLINDRKFWRSSTLMPHV